ncbi:MAG: DUF58 domain-containing protein [Cryobacterium sp.]|nr:DUF58 domain-containing protein [Oligoflexia bacterium]
MLPEELRKKVKLIEITTKRVIDDVMSGSYRSHFKGQGMQFAEHRVYVAGDDVRHIDWKVSARTKEPLVKKFEEERELNVLFVVDFSASGTFGSKSSTKGEASAEIAALLATAAERIGDKTGLILFAGQVEKRVPPKRGKSHLLRIVRDILGTVPKTKGTNLTGALEIAARIMKHQGIVFVISDFMAENYETALKRLARKNEVVAVRVRDGHEWTLPNVGAIAIVDPETGEEGVLDPRSQKFKAWFEKMRRGNDERFKQACRGAGIEVLPVDTREDHVQAVVRFFQARNRIRRA